MRFYRRAALLGVTLATTVLMIAMSLPAQAATTG
jgi:hypothetical protein